MDTTNTPPTRDPDGFGFIDISITRWEPDFGPLELHLPTSMLRSDGWEYMGTDDLERIHYRRRGHVLAPEKRLRLDINGNHA
jgi:hypothetical protein